MKSCAACADRLVHGEVSDVRQARRGNGKERTRTFTSSVEGLVTLPPATEEALTLLWPGSAHGSQKAAAKSLTTSAARAGVMRTMLAQREASNGRRAAALQAVDERTSVGCCHAADGEERTSAPRRCPPPYPEEV